MAKKNDKLKFTLTTLGDLLLQIERCNERIKTLATYHEPELEQSILNAQSIRSQFLRQLDELLAEYSLEVRLKTITA